MQKLIILALLVLFVLSLGATSTDSSINTGIGVVVGSSTGIIVDNNIGPTPSDENNISVIASDSNRIGININPVSSESGSADSTINPISYPIQTTDSNRVVVISTPNRDVVSDTNSVDQNNITQTGSINSSVVVIVSPRSNENSLPAKEYASSIFNPTPVSDLNSIEEVAISRDKLREVLVSQASYSKNDSNIQLVSSNVIAISSAQEVRAQVQQQILEAVALREDTLGANRVDSFVPSGSIRENNFVVAEQVVVEKRVFSEVVKENDSNIIKSVQRFVLEASNTTDENMYDVSLVEYIPKEIATSALEISSPYPFKVIQDDPIVEFVVPVLYPGEKFNLDYSIDGNVDINALNKTGLPVVYFSDVNNLPKSLKQVGIISTTLKGDLQEETIPLEFIVLGIVLVLVIVFVVLMVVKNKSPPTPLNPTMVPPKNSVLQPMDSNNNSNVPNAP